MADIFSTSISGLLAAQRQLATTSHNVSNVNTEGFSRQRTLQDARTPAASGAGFIGTGVNTTTVQRIFDESREMTLRQTSSEFSRQNLLAEFTGRIDNLVADKQAGLSPALQSFFDAAQDLANDPTSPSARQVLLSQAESLAGRFELLEQRLASLDTDVNNQLKGNVEAINNLSGDIARLNGEIVQAQGRTGQPPNDLMDKRDTLIRQLSEKVGTQTINQADGSVNVFIGNGQGVVVGNQSNLLATRPNAFDPQQVEIVYQQRPGATPVTITRNLSGGEVGGLLDMRRNVIDPTRNDLGRLAVTISETFNAQHRLGLQFDSKPPDLGGDFFQIPLPEVRPGTSNTGTLTPAMGFNAASISELTSSDYRALYDDTAQEWTVTRLNDNDSFTVAAGDSLTRDGLIFDFGPVDANDDPLGTPEDGDSFLIRPTRLAASGLDLAIQRPNQIAAASPLNAMEATNNGQAINQGDAAIKNLSVEAMTPDQLESLRNDGPLSLRFEVGDPDPDAFVFSPPLPAGDVTVTANNDGFDFVVDSEEYGTFSFRIAGMPADNDAFTISVNDQGKGDNGNALTLAALADAKTVEDASATYQEFYAAVVGRIGNDTLRAQTNRDAQQTLLTQAKQAREEVSGVNLEEEAANLLRFQQAFQANAQTITIANTLFQTVLDAVRR